MKGIPRKEALFYHQKLPKRLWRYFRRQGFSDEFIHRHLLGWDGKRITVPVFGPERELVFFEYLTDPQEGPVEVVEHTRPHKAFLYGYETLASRPERVVLVKGVWDRLVLLSRGIPSVAIVGDPEAFREEWSSEFRGTQVVVVFPRTGKAHREAIAVAEKIGLLAISQLPAPFAFYPPAEATVAAFFLHGGTRRKFLRLLPPVEHESPGEGAA